MRFSPAELGVCGAPPRREPRRLNFVADVERQAGIDVGLKITDPDILVVVDACGVGDTLPVRRQIDRAQLRLGGANLRRHVTAAINPNQLTCRRCVRGSE